MGGAGAGGPAFLFVPLMYGGTALAWLIAAILTWVLVLPSWTRVSVVLCLLSCCFHALTWNSEPETIVSYAAIVGIVALSIGVFLVVPLAMGYRLYSLFFGLAKHKLSNEVD